MDSGVWTVDCGLWTVDCGLWTVDCGLWTVDCGLWTVDCGLWSVKCGVWSVKCGVWSVKCGVWTVDCGRGAWGLGLCNEQLHTKMGLVNKILRKASLSSTPKPHVHIITSATFMKDVAQLAQSQSNLDSASDDVCMVTSSLSSPDGVKIAHIKQNRSRDSYFKRHAVRATGLQLEKGDSTAVQQMNRNTVHEPTKRRVCFSNKIAVSDTYTSSQYNRKSLEKTETENVADIYRELMIYKLTEMNVHDAAIYNTNQHLNRAPTAWRNEMLQICNSILSEYTERFDC
ncbi:hypothetical protein SARC_09984 [Sphaeroforma arctica JP610]|uniref:Uncharacterized protein n=1 Tax=Sphaeroforma arctica JP610 TaxID=667725 RepID=A0A0L0FNH0_9EUKA|nr:hypothetical protein SARC_09984 [Sphaeroforma arctica JP610]KNC77553.1 hypothetical protein SARC_09984 [Sphaeroforma arctica JP610]|eukprot:XP_014151455.1 hypothetical protein SARC_09984 [Sphaeroforma arctica JP610]